MLILLFDIDGTLVRTGGAGKAAMEAALRAAFGIGDVRGDIPYGGRTDRAIAGDLLALHGRDPSAANVARLHAAYLDHLPAALRAGRGEICPGVAELLPRLAGRADVRLGLLTGNTRRGAERKLAHFGLWDYFPVGGFGDDHTDRDDVARSAVAAVSAHVGLAVDPAAVWVIGDTPLDVRCARAVGANAVVVATGWTPIAELHATGADVVLEHLADLAKLPAVWFPGGP
jgi:phosphoglycolate phosphatase-like HAD superfamily hydrolase